MIGRRLFVHAIFLTIAPIIVAWFGLSVAAATLLVLLLLLWRWLVVLSGWIVPAKTPELVLATISASHFVEKVRWSMDRLGLDYIEQASGGTLGAFFGGRSVPQLKIRTGAVQSSIGNSAEILRYLWGRYAVDQPEAAAFLEPTRERVDYESRLDRYGTSLQVWIYYHILNDRDVTLHAWGANCPATPVWQRPLLRLLFPLLRLLIRKSFRITDANYERAVARIDEMLGEADAWLEDGRKSLLGGDAPNYTDFAFAAMTGLFFMPPGYGGGKAEGVRLTREQVPEGMRQDIEGWEAKHERALDFVARLYEEERQSAAPNFAD